MIHHTSFEGPSQNLLIALGLQWSKCQFLNPHWFDMESNLKAPYGELRSWSLLPGSWSPSDMTLSFFAFLQPQPSPSQGVYHGLVGIRWCQWHMSLQPVYQVGLGIRRYGPSSPWDSRYVDRSPLAQRIRQRIVTPWKAFRWPIDERATRVHE